MLWFVLGCVFGDVKALKAEVEALKDEVDELEEELDEQSQVDTGEPVDTEDSGGGDSEEPFEVPTVRFFYTLAGSSPNYTYTHTIDISGDYDAKRVSVVVNGAFNEPEEDCIEYVSSGGVSSIYVEFWYNGNYDCWTFTPYNSYPDCHQIPVNMIELSCD